MKKLMELPEIETAFHQLMQCGDYFAASNLSPPLNTVTRPLISPYAGLSSTKNYIGNSHKRFTNSISQGTGKFGNLIRHHLVTNCLPPMHNSSNVSAGRGYNTAM